MTIKFTTYNEDCLQKLQTLEEESIDLILTDPPYNISRENNFHTMRGQRGIDFGEWDKGFDVTQWVGQAIHTLKPGGSIIIFTDIYKLGYLAEELKENGIQVKDTITWVKDNPIPRNRDRRYITDYEVALWGVKPKAKWTFNRQNDKYDRCTFHYPLVGNGERIHPTQKPVKLMKDLILRHSNEGETILDPFMGSGATGVACIELGRDFIGIELDKTYYKLTKERLKKAKEEKDREV